MHQGLSPSMAQFGLNLCQLMDPAGSDCLFSHYYSMTASMSWQQSEGTTIITYRKLPRNAHCLLGRKGAADCFVVIIVSHRGDQTREHVHGAPQASAMQLGTGEMVIQHFSISRSYLHGTDSESSRGERVVPGGAGYMGQRQGWAREQLRLEGKSWLPGGVFSESTSSIEYKGLQNSVSE